MSSIKKLSMVLGLLFTISLYGQLNKRVSPNLISESEVYFDEKLNERYSDLITFKFKKNIVNISMGSTIVNLNDIGDQSTKDWFVKIKKKYGEFKIVKLIPTSVWGDTLAVNKRTGRITAIPDWSQVFQIQFSKLVPIDLLIEELYTLKFIEYAEGPFQAYSMLEPNDTKFINENNWAFEKIEAEKAWDITTGDSSIIIAIHDLFGNINDNTIHKDLVGKVDSHFGRFGNHGTCVAGVAGANTNNDLGIASLGWNLHLRFYNMTYTAPEILRAVSDGVDVINFSWVRRVDIQSLRDAIKTALANGVICVAAAGNKEENCPEILYPAAYNFGEIGQVIAVGATEYSDVGEFFIDGWNYSPGQNPIIDPEESFIDVAAPGRDISMLDRNRCTGYLKGCGTSLSAPFVSALAGLILSINNTLSPNEVYDIITQTADKIGQYSYDENGWNQYLGYGRINAYQALLAAKRITNVSEIVKTEIPNNCILEQNYPNPFNPSTKVRFTLPQESFVDLRVFDVLGNEIVTLVNEKKQSGIYEVIFDINKQVHIASGVYLFKLSTNNFVEIKKGILIK